MTLLKKIIGTFFLLATFNGLFAQYEAVFKIPFPKQYHVLDSIILELIKKDSITAEKIIYQLKVNADQTNDKLVILNYKRAVLNYRFIRTDDIKNDIAVKKVIRDAEALLTEVRENKYPEIAAMINITLGYSYYYKSKQFNLAFEHFIRAYNLFKHVSVEDFPDRQYSQYTIALAYYQFNDFKNALQLGKEIESLYPKKNYISVFTVGMMGMCYQKMQKYDSAIASFQWILDNNKHLNKSPAWEGIAAGNLGNVYFMQGRYDEALPYLERAVKITTDEKIHDNTAGFASHLSTIYLKQNNIPLAKKYVDIAQQAAYKDNSASNYYNVYLSLSEYYKQTGNPRLALMYLDSSMIFKDSLAKTKDVNLKYQAEMAIENDRKREQEKMFREEKSRQVLIRNGLIVLIFLVMLITLLFYNHTRLKNKHREHQLLVEKQIAEKELTNAVIQLNDFTKSIIDKNELIEKAAAEIERINTAYQQLQNQKMEALTLPVADENSLNLLQQSVLLTDDAWKSFTQLFDKVHPGFFSRVKEKLPELSPAETRFVALSKLKLNNKEMAAMLGVSTDAIRQSRSRLRKKLLLNEDAGIEEALERI